MTRGYRLVVAANRLPLRRTPQGGWIPSPGGLVSAVGPLLAATQDACWVGWDGARGGSPSPPPGNPVDLHAVGLSEPEVEGFYEGLSNQALWPLYHDRLREPVWRREWWDHFPTIPTGGGGSRASDQPPLG